MADVTVTAASVRPLTEARTRRGTAGEALTGGQTAFLDGANGYKKTDDDTPTTCRGIVVQESVASGEEFDLVTDGPVTGFSGMTPGTTYYISTTAGAIAPAADTANDVPAGWAESATVLIVKTNP